MQLAEKRLPTLAELDAAAQNNPVLLFPGLNGPSATNTPGKAFLEAKGIAVSADGLIAAANPSMAALDAIRALETSDDLRRTALEVTSYALSFGVTTHEDQAARSSLQLRARPAIPPLPSGAACSRSPPTPAR